MTGSIRRLTCRIGMGARRAEKGDRAQDGRERDDARDVGRDADREGDRDVDEAGRLRWHVHGAGLGFTAGSAVVHAAALLVGAWLASPSPSGSEPSPEQIAAMQRYLVSALEEEAAETRASDSPDEAPRASNDARIDGSKEGGAGTRAKGHEGSMGAAAAHATSSRFGVAGPSNVERAAALREAAEFGIIGLLGAGAGGDPAAPVSPWGQVGAGAGFAAGHGLGAIAQGTGSAKGAGIVAVQAGAAREPLVRIDPNGRFATTYRPGGGHLAAFESAVARGIVPAAEREIVSDVGARYVPDVPLSPDRALGLRVDLERAALPPSGGPFHVRLSLRGSDQRAGARPQLAVHLVVDTSGSMAGEPIVRVREAARALVDRLAPADRFSLVTFSSDASVAVPEGPVGARRDAILAAIARLEDGGGTNIGRGLELGYEQASSPSTPADAVRVVLLLSDGQPTEGIRDRGRLAALALEAFQRGIQTSSFGIGESYDGALMTAIAADGAGGYYYLRDPEQIAPALATEIDRRLDPVATAVEVRVRLERGIDLLHAYGSRRLGEAEAARVRAQEVAADVQAERKDGIRRDRDDDPEGGMRFFIPAFARGDAHAILLRLAAPEGVGARRIASVELRYKDRLGQRNVVEERVVGAAYADSDAASARTADASVARAVQGFAAGEALLEAAMLVGRNDRGAAAALLAEREGILRQAATSLGEPLLARDADRLSRLRRFAGDSAGLGDPLVLAMLLETAGRSHMR